MSEKAIIFFNNVACGVLTRKQNHFEFQYMEEYLNRKDGKPIGFCFPLTPRKYSSETFFPFFAGLLSEGWNRETQSVRQKIDEKDYFSLLLANGRDLIGAVSVYPESEAKEMGGHH